MKTLGLPIVIGGDNLPSPVGIGLTDLPNIGGTSGPGSGITGLWAHSSFSWGSSGVKISMKLYSFYQTYHTF